MKKSIQAYLKHKSNSFIPLWKKNNTNFLSFYKKAYAIYKQDFVNLYNKFLLNDIKKSLIISFLPNNVYLIIFNNIRQKIEKKFSAHFLKVKCTIRQRSAVFKELIQIFFRDFNFQDIDLIKIKHNTWYKYQSKLYYCLNKFNNNIQWEWYNLLPHNGCRVKKKNNKTTYFRLNWFH
jgi:hypothetical protein